MLAGEEGLFAPGRVRLWIVGEQRLEGKFEEDVVGHDDQVLAPRGAVLDRFEQDPVERASFGEQHVIGLSRLGDGVAECRHAAAQLRAAGKLESNVALLSMAKRIVALSPTAYWRTRAWVGLPLVNSSRDTGSTAVPALPARRSPRRTVSRPSTRSRSDRPSALAVSIW